MDGGKNTLGFLDNDHILYYTEYNLIWFLTTFPIPKKSGLARAGSVSALTSQSEGEELHSLTSGKKIFTAIITFFSGDRGDFAVSEYFSHCVLVLRKFNDTMPQCLQDQLL